MAALSKRDIEMIFRAETDAAQRPVNELSADVKRLRGEMEALAKSNVKTDKSLDSLAKTTRELEQAQQELSNARTLLTQLNAQANALERAEASAEKATKKYNELKTQVDGAEAPTKRLTNSLAAAERGMNANNARVEEARKNYAEVKTSIEGIIGPVDNLQDAFRTVAVAQREITQGLTAAKGSVSAFKAEIADTATEAARLEQVDAFRKLASDSVAAQSAAERIEKTTAGAATAAQRLAQSILGIVNPAQEAAGTLDGMDNRLDAVINKINGGKLSVAEWSHLNNELQSIQAGLIGVAGAVDKFTDQQAKVNASAAAYDAQAAKVRALETAVVGADTNVEELTADLVRERKELASLGVELDRQTVNLNEMAAALQRVGVDSKALPNAIQRIESTAARAAPALGKVREVVTPGGKKGFLGLDPFQLQNLSYQVNDVFTGLASGQPIFQVFAQQAGQIVQIFPGIISGFMRWLPLIGPVAAAIAVLAGAIGEANTQLEAMRAANSTLATLGDTRGYDAQKFQDIAKAFRDMGVSADDALAATKKLVTEGLNPKAVDDYIVAAKNLSEVTGDDVKTSVEELTSAFTHGADEVIKLDDKYHFLTDTQRENLIASKDTKTEYEEVNKAFTALYNKMQEGARAQRTEMTDATNTLRNAWDALKQSFADTGVFQKVQGWLSDAVIGFTYLINLARRVGAAFVNSFSGAYQKSGGIAGILTNPAVFAANLLGGAIKQGPGILEGARDDTEAQYMAAQQRYNRPRSSNADGGEGSTGRQKEKEAKDKKDRKKAAADAKKAAREAEAARKRAAAEAERLRKQYENEQDQLQASLSRFTAEAMRGTSAPLEAQLEMARSAVDEQFKALEDRLSEFRDKFGKDAKINGQTQEQYKAALAAQKEQIKLNRQLGVYESNVNDLLKERDTRLKSIKEEQDAGLLSAQEALDKTNEVTSEMGPRIDAAIASARAFIAALEPSAETQAMLAKFDSIIKQGGGSEGRDTIARKSVATGLGDEEDKLNDIFQRRAALIEAANRLYDIGAINFTEKEARVKSAYDQTNKAITDQIAVMQTFLETNKDLFPPEVYERALAELQAYNAELKYTDTLTQAVKSSAQEAIQNGIMNMFDTLAQGIANIITGAGSLKDLFSDLGRAALNFAADFAASIAKAIMQIYALRIAKSLIGGFHGGGVVGDMGAGVMNLSRNIGIPDLNLSAVPRYHNGTDGAGLKRNEMLAVLETGEKVTTEEQQRLEAKRLKDAKEGNGRRGLRQILAIGDKEIASAMSGTAGDEVHMTWLQRNIPTIKSMLGINN